MTRSVYVVGGAAVGKSTFLDQLLTGQEFGPLLDLHRKPMPPGGGRRTPMLFQGHALSGGGLYLGRNTGTYRGTDGLDRICSPAAAEWLRETDPLPPTIVGEGATLTTRTFITALALMTDLLLVHLVADDLVRDLRGFTRGSSQSPEFLQSTATRARNLVRDFPGVPSEQYDAGDSGEWSRALTDAHRHLET